jgi:hypothetical protein
LDSYSDKGPFAKPNPADLYSEPVTAKSGGFATLTIKLSLAKLAMEQPVRRTPRFPFSAPAEVVRVGATSVEKTRVNELSLYGCYLDTKTPLPRGTNVTVKIISGGQFFEAGATVIYAQPTLGMGLAFREVKPAYLAVLQKWLRQALAKQNAPPPSIDDFEREQETDL